MGESLMKLKILYDNTIFEIGKGLKSDWGFSCIIETGNNNLLFDTGANPQILQNNMKILNLNPSDVDKIIISHEHWDHNGGLELFKPFSEKIELFRIVEKNNNLFSKTFEIRDVQEIDPYIITTGKLPGFPVDEQSLIIERNEGIYVIAGCSHSGVENIFRVAKQFGKIIGLIGGLHDFNNFALLEELKVICPTHCTSYKQKIQELFPEKYSRGGVGKIISL
jgi:7,8-dihydropterin-6-yl-methyl-4-(beta-D-ribofuranosyl)aminobenzene 5'-phosphate synthase